MKYDPIRDVKIPSVPYAVQERLLEYYRDHFYLFDNQEIFEANQSESILKVFQMAARRYGCKLFLADNLMTARNIYAPVFDEYRSIVNKFNQ